MKTFLYLALVLWSLCCTRWCAPQTEDSSPVNAKGVLLLIKGDPPVYPPLARQARIMGEVKLDLLIARTGAVSDVKVAQGHPMLAPAAVAAVKEWQFEPLLLNGGPVEVKTEIEVKFRLED